MYNFIRSGWTIEATDRKRERLRRIMMSTSSGIVSRFKKRLHREVAHVAPVAHFEILFFVSNLRPLTASKSGTFPEDRMILSSMMS